MISVQLQSVTIGDYYTPQPKQQEFHESPAPRNGGPPAEAKRFFNA